MASFKLNIATKEGKCYKTEVKDQHAAPLIGLNIGEKIEGSKLGLEGYELQLTGGMDYCGFPMRSGILGQRKKISIYKSTGFRGALKGIKRRKTVCGHKVNEKISAINLKVLKEGTKKLADMFGKKQEEGKAEEKTAKKEEAKAEEKQKEAKKEEPKKEAHTVKQEEKKEAKPQAEEKKEEKK